MNKYWIKAISKWAPEEPVIMHTNFNNLVIEDTIKDIIGYCMLELIYRESAYRIKG
jgi:hypothetical protein